MPALRARCVEPSKPDDPPTIVTMRRRLSRLSPELQAILQTTDIYGASEDAQARSDIAHFGPFNLASFDDFIRANAPDETLQRSALRAALLCVTNRHRNACDGAGDANGAEGFAGSKGCLCARCRCGGRGQGWASRWQGALRSAVWRMHVFLGLGYYLYLSCCIGHHGALRYIELTSTPWH